MAHLADGSGWLVLQPAFDADDAPRRIPSAGLFTGRPLAIAPACTWVPGERTRSGIEYVAVGIEHAARRQVGRSRDVAVPAGWVVQQDNARRGLVVAVPPAVPHVDVLRGCSDGGRAAPSCRLNGDWRALVYVR